MTIIDTSAPPAGIGIGASRTSFVRRFAAWLRRRRDIQRQRIELSQLSDHLRRDIGLPPRPLAPIDLCIGLNRYHEWR